MRRHSTAALMKCWASIAPMTFSDLVHTPAGQRSTISASNVSAEISMSVPFRSSMTESVALLRMLSHWRARSSTSSIFARPVAQLDTNSRGPRMPIAPLQSLAFG